jgi:hypothetical protein
MMKKMQIMFLFLLLIIFLSGMYVYMTKGISYEAFESEDNVDNLLKTSLGTSAASSCPDLLIRRGNILLLYNSGAPEFEGVNPLPFYSMDEYINYVRIKREQGTVCPVLYMQQENDAQGRDVYRLRPGPFEQGAGLPIVMPYLDASRDNGRFNQGNYPGFDPYGLFVGKYTTVDRVHDKTKMAEGKRSDNPMDPNWGGVLYTQHKVDSGKYDENAIVKPIFANAPNVTAVFNNTLPFTQVSERETAGAGVR